MGSSTKRRARATALARYERHRRANLLAVPGPHALVVVLDHLKASFNVAKVFRSAEVFGVREVHLIGIGPFDPAPAKGGLKAVPARSFETVQQSIAELQGAGYRCFRFAADAAHSLPEVALPERSAFLFGHEEFGCSLEHPAPSGLHGIAIPQYGRIDSLNVSVAASIAMYEYARQHGGRRS